MCWIKGSGYIKYDPYRPGLKKKKNWWAIVETDKEITRYYRWWVKKELHIELCEPSWNSHISIIRSEKPPTDKMWLWKKYDGKKIEFKYEHNVIQSGHYWLVEVDCPLLKQIRSEFGFPSNWNQHITIGRTW